MVFGVYNLLCAGYFPITPPGSLSILLPSALHLRLLVGLANGKHRQTVGGECGNRVRSSFCSPGSLLAGSLQLVASLDQRPKIFLKHHSPAAGPLFPLVLRVVMVYPTSHSLLASSWEWSHFRFSFLSSVRTTVSQALCWAMTAWRLMRIVSAF